MRRVQNNQLVLKKGRKAVDEAACRIDRRHSADWRAQQEGDDEDRGHRSIDTVVERTRPALKAPPMYKVVLLNDDYTPMEFVVEVLQTFFAMNREKATQIMLTVHTAGKATCGIYTRDIAETKSTQVNQFAQDNQHPLVSDVEAVED